MCREEGLGPGAGRRAGGGERAAGPHQASLKPGEEATCKRLCFNQADPRRGWVAREERCLSNTDLGGGDGNRAAFDLGQLLGPVAFSAPCFAIGAGPKPVMRRGSGGRPLVTPPYHPLLSQARLKAPTPKPNPCLPRSVRATPAACSLGSHNPTSEGTPEFQVSLRQKVVTA